jgi:GT2 family glycosyltransferase
MDVAIVIVGINGWAEYTLPAVQSIRQYEPDARIVVVDAASKTPYPVMWDAGITSIRLDPSPSYAYALNEGIKAAGNADWYLLLNNDVRLDGPITPTIDSLNRDRIYGRQIIEEKGFRWLGLWLALIPAWVWREVGEFDEKYLLCGFEDADYCLRAAALGFETSPVELPFVHYWGKTRWGLPHYNEVRAENMDYLEQKFGVRLGDAVTVTHD